MVNMGRGFRFVSHTAEAEFIASGRNAGEAVRNSLIALFYTISDISSVERGPERPRLLKLKVSSDNMADAVWGILQRVLSEAEAEDIFCYSVKRVSVTRSRLRITVSVEVLGKRKREQDARVEVKAVSRYNLSVKASGSIVRIRAVLDV